MSYATVQDMVARFGEPEVLRLSEPEDRAAEEINVAKVEVALADAAGLIDDYLRGRYVIPITSPQDSIVRAACVLARYDLAKGERTEPTEQMRLDRKEVIGWLESIAEGLIALDAPRAGNAGKGSAPRISDRRPAFSDHQLREW